MPWNGKPFGWGAPVAYLGYLPEPEEAGINILRQMHDMLFNGDGIGGSTIKITINYLEAPSVRLATDLFLRANNLKLKVQCVVEAVPKPDPRKSKAKKYLWKYWFKEAKPAVAAPSDQFMKACASLASRDYSYQQNWQDAKALAQKAKPELIWQILAVMVHPPLPPRDTPAWIWLPRIQLAAAQWVANIEILNNIPIEQSALVEVARGPIDWTIDAAVIALTQRQRESNSNSDWLCGLCFDVIERLPREGYWSTYTTTLQNMLLLPHLAESVRTDIQATLDAVLAQNA